MFIGHYSAALALKKVEKNASLGWLFLAVQLVDILLFVFVLLGVERLNIVKNFTPSTHFKLAFIPYTHSLAGSLAWAVIVYGLVRFLPAKQEINRAQLALVLGAAVLSHWFLDLVVHTPDLPLLGDSSTKLGLGLWNSAGITFILEAGLVTAGAWYFLSRNTAVTKTGRYGLIALAGLLILMNGFTIYGPPPESEVFLAIVSLGSYFGLGAAAFWLERHTKRAPATP